MSLRFRLIEGRRDLSTPKSKVLGRDSFKSMGVACGDINQDGLLGLFVSNIASEYALEESHLAFVSDRPIGRTVKERRSGFVRRRGKKNTYLCGTKVNRSEFLVADGHGI